MISAPRTGPGYVLVCLAGAGVLVVGAPFLRAHIVRQQMEQAGRLLERGQPVKALERVRRWESWAAAFPPLDLEMRGRKTACLADLRRWSEAEKLASGIRYGERSPAPRGLAHLLQAPGIGMVNAMLIGRARREGVTKWLGYEALVPEWAEEGDRARIEAFVEELHGRKVSPALQAVLARYRAAPKEEAAPVAPARETAALPGPAGPAPGTPPPRPVPSPGSAHSWGVVKTVKTGVYDRNGKLIARARAGTIVDIREKKTTKAGRVLVCRILDSKADNTKDYVLRARDVEMREGAYAKASEREKSLTIEAAGLQSEIDAASRVAADTVDPNNPHRAAYMEAKKAYDHFWQKVTALEKERDTATGDQRVAALDGLRELKGKDVRVGRDFEAAKSRHDAWNRSHSQPASNGDIEGTHALKTRLAKVRQELANLGSRP